jgi:reactive intermediate/imine deaminase
MLNWGFAFRSFKIKNFPTIVATTMKKTIVNTNTAPKAIGTYSQAVKIGDTVYLSGQIALDPVSGELVGGEVGAQIEQVFRNLAAVAKAAGGSLADVVKLNVFLTELKHFPLVNETMARHFREPYPARAAIGVAALPRGAQVEMDAVMVLVSSAKRKTRRRGAEAQRKAKVKKKKR